MEIRLTSPLLAYHVDVRLARRGSRWVAVAETAGKRHIGLGGTAHQALAGSVAFLGRRAAAALLADPELMAASSHVL